MPIFGLTGVHGVTTVRRKQRCKRQTRPVNWSIARNMPIPVLDRKRTSTADILLVRRGWVEQRYLKDAQFTDETVRENRDTIVALGAGAPYVLLNVFPLACV